MTLTMGFFTSVYALSKYYDAMKPVLVRMSPDIRRICSKCVRILKCDPIEIQLYVWITITVVINYMIFGNTKYINAQLRVIKAKIEECFLAKN